MGPILAVFGVEYWTWRGIFLINVPIGIILILLAVRLIPKLPASGRQRFDFSGVALLGVTVIAFMVGITNLGSAHAGISDPGVAVPLVVGLAFGCLFVRHTRKRASTVHPGPPAVRPEIRCHEPHQLPLRLRCSRFRCAGPALRPVPDFADFPPSTPAAAC